MFFVTRLVTLQVCDRPATAPFFEKEVGLGKTAESYSFARKPAGKGMGSCCLFLGYFCRLVK